MKDVALCASSGVDPETFFPYKETGTALKTAKEICAACPVMQECRELAVRGPSWLEGIWGGTTFEERIQIRKRLRIAPTRSTFGSDSGLYRENRQAS